MTEAISAAGGGNWPAGSSDPAGFVLRGESAGPIEPTYVEAASARLLRDASAPNRSITVSGERATRGVEANLMHSSAQQLHDRARKCRELADTAVTAEGRSILFEIAQRYEQEAATSDISTKREPVAEAAA